MSAVLTSCAQVVELKLRMAESFYHGAETKEVLRRKEHEKNIFVSWIQRYTRL
jgi:hypothetical protein